MSTLLGLPLVPWWLVFCVAVCGWGVPLLQLHFKAQTVTTGCLSRGC